MKSLVKFEKPTGRTSEGTAGCGTPLLGERGQGRTGTRGSAVEALPKARDGP